MAPMKEHQAPQETGVRDLLGWMVTTLVLVTAFGIVGVIIEMEKELGSSQTAVSAPPMRR